ncbi:MAG: nitrate reductase subunit alpha [Bacteroidia bacterium 43-41]|nr:MAG: nitrate reductase subunit alpha [Bacteroidia bacterium 43-41]
MNKSFLKKKKYFVSLENGEERAWEHFYRNRWQHDKEVRSTHGVNCTGSCSWKIFVKKGIVAWEIQQTDYPQNRPDLPNHEPRGCPRGASYSWYLYNSGRVKHPMIRHELVEAYQLRKSELHDPVLAWEAVMNDEKASKTYKERRGLGGFVRMDWNLAEEIIAAANIYTIKKYGPDRLVGFTPIPAFSMVSYASGARYLSLIGGTMLSFYDFYCDLPPASPQTWGEQTDVPESADWYNSSFIMMWGSNVPVTRTPDAPFLTQVRYKGTKVITISSDYSDASKFGDIWLNPKQGTDSALGMAMGHVILKEFFVDRTTPYFDSYVRTYSDLPFLVKIEPCENGYRAGMMLRASDFDDNLGMTKQPEWYPVLLDEESGGLVIPNGSIGTRWNEKGKWNLRNEDVRTGKAFTPLLSVMDKKEGVIDVSFPFFGGEAYKNPHFNASQHDEVQVRKIPVVTFQTTEGEVMCATVFDIMLAHYGVERGLDDPCTARNYSDNIPYTPKWQEQITGVAAEKVITVARQFAETAEKTQGKSMIIIGAGVNQWYNTDMTYRAAMNMLILCGTVGQSGGGWAHYVGQEKVRPQSGWATLAFASDWIRPPRHMNTTSYFYMHSDQWRYEKVKVEGMLSPLFKKDKWKGFTLLDCNIKSQRMGWLPASPEFDRSSLQLCKDAENANMGVAEYVTAQLHSGQLNLASEDLDKKENSPKNLFIWRANLIGSSAKGVEYFMKYLLGAQNSVFGKDLKQLGHDLPMYQKWHEEGTKGKLDLVVTIDYRMTTSSLHSDIVLPAATWYEKNDLSSTDMHPFLHPFSKAVDPVWESRNDWDIFKGISARFSALCTGHLGVEKDVVMQPLMHDSPGEISEPLFVDDWKESGSRPVPGHNMGNLIVVERNYPDTYKRYTSLGPLLEKAGITGKGITWSSKEEYAFLKQLNGVISEEGGTQGMPKLETDIHAIESILSLAPESNGIAARKAWSALEKTTGLALGHLTKEGGETQIRYDDLVQQPRRVLNSPIWSGLESHEVNYTASYTNVHELIPWRTVTGRQSVYQDHPWMLAFGEGLVCYKPPLSKEEVRGIKERLGITDDTLTLNLITPHNKWSIHSTWSDNLIMLTLGRGGPVIWISETDAQKINIKDNDWVEVFNDNGTASCRAIVSQRIPEGALIMYHNQERTVNMPLSSITGNRGGIHNSISRVCPKPTHMIGGYAQLAFGLNYYGTIGANRDEFVLIRKCETVLWEDGDMEERKEVFL